MKVGKFLLCVSSTRRRLEFIWCQVYINQENKLTEKEDGLNSMTSLKANKRNSNWHWTKLDKCKFG